MSRLTVGSEGTLFPSYRLAGQGGGRSHTNWPFGFWPYRTGFNTLGQVWPAIADSYSPYYSDPQTVYGACDCAGGALRRNKCNFQQGGYQPQCLADGYNCRCYKDESDWGCFNSKGSNCM